MHLKYHLKLKSMTSHFMNLIILAIIIYYSAQKINKSGVSFILKEFNERNPNYKKLREWLNSLNIEIPNDLIKNYTLGLLEDLTIYDISLDKLITIGPEVNGNRTGVNISLEGIGINIKGIYHLLKTKHIYGHISNLNLTLPFYLVRDPEKGLVSEVDTTGLNVGLDNAEIEIDLELGDFIKDVLMAILRELLSGLKERVIESSLVDLMNTKLGELFQQVNGIIENGIEPKPLNITFEDKDISNLKKSPLISAVRYLLNNLIGIDGPININNLVNIITYDTGIVYLHEFYNKSINFGLNLTDKNNAALGNIDISLDDLNVSGLNTWNNFTALEPLNKISLYSYTDLQNLAINISFSIKLTLDNTSYLVKNETILYEKAMLRTNLVNNKLKAYLQLPANGKKAYDYSNRECFNLECLTDLLDSNGTGISSLSLNETFEYILLEVDGEKGGLEEDLDGTIDKLIDLFITTFGEKISLFINALLNTTLIDLVNKEINNYLYSSTCPNLEDPDDSEISKSYTTLAFSLAFFLFSLLIFCPYILGKALKKDKSKNNLIDSENRVTNVSEMKNGKTHNMPANYCFPHISIQCFKEFGRTDPQGASLFLNPRVPLFWRIFIPLSIFATIALFVSSNTGTGAQVFVVFNAGRRVQLPSLFDFGLVNSVRDMWKAGVYPLSILIALFSGIWPYLKLVLMLISFVLPSSLFSSRKRKKILLVLDATGKWSILDSYVMTLMLVAFHFHIEFPVVEPSEADEGSLVNVFVYAAYGFFSLILGTIISLCLSHIITHIDRNLDEHPDQDKGEKAESYTALISFAESKYLGKTFFRVFISFLLFLTLGLCIIGSFITSFSFYFHGLAGYALDLFKNSPQRKYSVIDLGFSVPESYENPNDGVIRFTQVIYFLTVFVLPVTMLLTVIFLWFIPLPRKAQKHFYTIVEILNAWSCLDVFVVAIVAAILEIGQFTEFIVGDKCDSINPYIEKYFYKPLDGHNTCFEVQAYLKSGCWLLFVAAIIYNVASNIVMKVCRNALDERMPPHVKEYLKNKNDEERISGIIDNASDIENTGRETLIQPSNNEISNINNTRFTDNKEVLDD